MPRQDIVSYGQAIAKEVARRSTCLDKQVGCVLMSETGIILATGYNGAPRGVEHCLDCAVEQHDGDKSWCVAAHAEQNAMLYADPEKVHYCFSTLEPCIMCTRMLMNTACKEVVYDRSSNRSSNSCSGRFLWKRRNSPATWRHRPFIGV